MAESFLFLADTGPRDVGRHRVHTKARWADDWVEQPHLVAVQTVWSAMPSMPVATLEWQYGTVKYEDGQAFILAEDRADELIDKFVKIVHETEYDAENESWKLRNWYGIIQDSDVSFGGTTRRGDDDVVTGLVTFRCYGMEYLLSRNVIDNSWFDGVPLITVGRVDKAFGFNIQRGAEVVFPNRSAVKHEGKSYVFSHKAPEIGDEWSTVDIVEYLLNYHGPTNEADEVAIPFAYEVLDGCPADWDAPQLEPDGRTTYSVLSQLLDRRRMCVAWFDVDILEQTVVLKVDSVTPTPVTLGLDGAVNWPEASNQVSISSETDPLTDIALRTTLTPVYDAVVARGDRIRAVGTFSFTGADTQSLDVGWSSSLEAEYEAGASGAGYNSQSLLKDRKQQHNDAARRNPRLSDVFSKFEISSDWDQFVNGYDGASDTPLFWNGDAQVWHSWSEVFIDQRLPLFVGIDYSGTAIVDGLSVAPEQDAERMRPLVCFKKPDKGDGQVDERWVKAEAMGSFGRTGGRLGLEKHKSNPRVSVDVRVPYNAKHLLLNVKNAPQHAIAKTDFNKLPEDRFEGWWEYRDMVATLSITTQMWVEGRWPAEDPEKDAVSYKVIDAGKKYTAAYIAPATVVDVDATTGELLTSGGGWIPKEDPQADNFAVLEAIAKVAASWYTVPHSIVRLNTFRIQPAEELDIGMLVKRVNALEDNEVVCNSVITQISINVPNGSVGPQEPMMQVTTWAGEMHPDLDFGQQVIQNFEFDQVNDSGGGHKGGRHVSPGLPGGDRHVSGGVTNLDPRQFPGGAS